MAKKSSFFPGWHKILFGRPPVSEIEKISRQRSELDGLSLSQLTALFGSFLPTVLLDFKTSSGPNSRCRVYTPMVTFWAFLGQVLAPGSSCRRAVSSIQALFAARQLELPSCDTKSYCSARRRLPVRLLLDVLSFVAGRLQAGVGAGPRTLVVDGSNASMPDTPENQKKYPQHMQKPGCGFPMMKLVGLFCLESGAWIATAKGHLRLHESRLFQRLIRHLREGDTLLADRAYCSYWNIAVLASKGVDFVMRNHQTRKVDFRRGKGLGKRDHCIEWRKPRQRPRGMSREQYDAFPDHLVLRETQLRAPQRKGYRTEKIVVISSFIVPGEKTVDELGEYFLRRWKVELYFDDIKTSQAMDVLRTKSPELICRELLMHMIAYNLIRALALCSTASSATPMADRGRVSFKGTADRIATWAWGIWAAPTARRARDLVQQLHATIAEDLVPERPGRREPRVKKRRPKNYQLMTKPRHQMVEIQHRNVYRAPA